MKPCPIKGCSRKWKTKDGLVAHLQLGHHKGDLIGYIVDQVEE